MSTTKTIAKGSAWMLVSAVIVKFFAWIYYVLLSRTVSQEEIGMFSLVLSVISLFLIFANLGLGGGSVKRFVPFYAGESKFNHIKHVLKISIFVGTFFSIICFVLVLLFTGKISEFLKDSGLIPVFYIMAFYILIYNFYAISNSFLQGRKLIKFVSYTTNLQEIFKLILTAFFLFFMGFKAESIAFGFVLSFVFVTVIALWWAFKAYKALPKSEEKVCSFWLLKEMVPFGLNIVLISSMSMINSYISIIMLGCFLPPEINTSMAGIYTIVFSFSGVILIFGVAIGMIFFPLITEFLAKRDMVEINKTTTTVLRWLFITATPILIIIFIFSKQILTVIYGEDYAVGYIALILCSLGFFMSLFSLPSQWILSAMKRLDVTTKIIAAGAISNIVLNFILIPEYGINGAAFASLLSFAVMTFLFLVINKITNIRFPKDIYKPLTSGILAAVILYLAATVFDFDEVLINFISSAITQKDIFSEILLKFLKVFTLGIFILTAFFVYLVFLIKFKAFHKEDVEILSGGMRRAKIPEKWILFAERILLR